MWGKDEFEKYAISVLEFFYPELSGMIKCESPDYCNGEIGVEIRRAITENDGEVDGFWRKNQNCRFQDLPPKQLKKLGFKESPSPVDSKMVMYSQRSLKNGCLYYYKQKDTGDFILCAYIGKTATNSFTVGNIDVAVREKLGKMNDHYKIKRRNDLCVLIQEQLNYFVCQEEIIDDLLRNTISSIKTVYEEKNYTHFFDNIFLVFLDNVFCINTKTWEFTRKIITQEQIDHIAVQMNAV